MHPATDPGDDRHQVPRGNWCIEIRRAPVDMEVPTGGLHFGRLEQRSQRHSGRNRYASYGTTEDDDPGDGLLLSHPTLRLPNARAG